MRQPPLWQQAGTYPAQLDRLLLATLWPNGGAVGALTTVVNNTMTVSVAPGTAAVPLVAGQGSAVCSWDAPEVVDITNGGVNPAPPAGQSRIDLIVVKVRDNSFDGGQDNDFILTSVPGAPAAANPQPSVVPANSYAVARVLVPGAVANLNTATITDVRGLGLGTVQCRARVYRNAAWNVAATATVIPYDAKSYDDLNAWDLARQGFVCPVDGTYFCHHVAGTNTSQAGDWLGASWQRSGNSTKGLGGSPVACVPVGWGFSASSGGCIPARAGDLLTPRLGAGRVIAGQTGEQYTYAQVTLIQPGAVPVGLTASFQSLTREADPDEGDPWPIPPA